MPVVVPCHEEAIGGGGGGIEMLCVRASIRESITKLVSVIDAPIYTIFDPVMHATIALEFEDE